MDNKYRFQDEGQRIQRMNRLLSVIATTIWVVLFLFFGMKYLNSTEIPKPISILGAIINICFIPLTWTLNKKHPEDRVLRLFVSAAFGSQLLVIGVLDNVQFIFIASLMILVSIIPYNDMKLLKTCTILVGICDGVLMIYNIRRSTTTNIDDLFKILVVICGVVLIYRIGLLVKWFSDDMCGAAVEESGKSKEMLNGIVDMSETVSEETSRSAELVDRLVASMENVAQSMKEISAATSTTSDSIRDQNTMTQTIQDSIMQTSERSKQMVSIATNSDASVQNNMKLMEELQKQAEQISDSNHAVSSSMEKLQQRTKDVEEITQMILNISSQTNLLALNASIESARAGEAGRGFAVVADQIRQLADQTRQSTEKITQIVNELNANANDAAASIATSVSAMNNQSEKIELAYTSFVQMEEDMKTLIDNINALDQDIVGLEDSNNKIVENISQLSASTEEITASAEDVLALSEKNLSEVTEIKDSITVIQEKTEDMAGK